MVAAVLGPVIVTFDDKGELALLDNLINAHGIKSTDAQHLMIAHSASLDRVLTWDKRLVRKAAKVKWLRPHVEPPDTFFER